MAFDMFIKFTPDVPGESQDDNHKGEIDVVAWSWGMTQIGTMHMGTGGGSGKAQIQDISFSKYVDKASPVLLLALCRGTHYNKVNLVVRKAGGEAPLEFYKIELTKAIISSISIGVNEVEERMTENIVINFAEFKVSYQAQNADGGKLGGEVSASFDIPANKAK